MLQPHPVSTSERLESLDVLRGFALLGILAMNIRAMSAPFGTYMYPYAMWEFDGVNRAAYLFTSVVFDLKMMGLFSMLFGAGVLLYSAKPTETGKPPRGLWYRRMFWLLVIGLVHGYLIWDGDILVPYALCGMLVLWWARRLPAWGLLTLSLVFLSIGTLASIGHGFSWNQMPEADRAREAAFMMPTREQAQAQQQILLGSYSQIVAARAPFVIMAQTLYFVAFFLWRCAGMMLLGMALFKWGFLDGKRSSGAYAAAALVCLPLGWALAGYGVTELERVRFSMPERTIADLWNYAGATFASIGYASAVLFAVSRGMFAGLRRRLAAVGQMAFSNYLFHSVTTAILFLGWGVGLSGRFDYAQQLLVVAAIWTIQLIVSPIWLSAYRFGPAEWLWRSLTYWERQPMKRTTPQVPAIGGSAAV